MTPTGKTFIELLIKLGAMTTTHTIELDEVTTEPLISGDYGRAWKVDMEKQYVTADAYFIAEGKPIPVRGYGEAYVIEAPLAHPAWHSYLLLLYALKPENTRFVEGATHEFAISAMNPDVPRQDIIDGVSLDSGALSPPNFGAQIIGTNADAMGIVEGAILDIVEGRLDPDTDHIGDWIDRFGSAMLKKVEDE
jgi:hypothetical protein